MILLDRWFPPRGRCGFCGSCDGRHRILDAIVERHRFAGESVEELAEDYGYPVRAIQAVVVLWRDAA